MDLLNLVIRTLAFLASVWVLLEFIFTCKVSNPVAAGIIIGGVAFTVLIFFLFQRDKITVCDKCKSPYIPRDKNASMLSSLL